MSIIGNPITLGGGKSANTITVSVDSGSVVTASNGDKTVSAVSVDGLAVLKVPKPGTWTVTAALGDSVTESTVEVFDDFGLELSYEKIYGISRDITASSPAWTRTDDAVGFTATASVGTAAGASSFDSCYPWSEIQRETLSTGDVMVKIPKFWFQRYREGNVEHIRIADKAVDGFTLHPAFNHAGVETESVYVGAYMTSSSNKSVSGATPNSAVTITNMRTYAKNKGAGWGVIDISTVSAVQMLLLVEFANNNVQAVIGTGVSGSGAVQTGQCNSVPNLTGRPSGTDGTTNVVYRGIEDFWGAFWEWTDGILLSTGKYYVCNDPSKYSGTSTTDYEQLSFSGMTNWSGSYITALGLDTGGNEHILVPSAAGSGSESTYMCDACSSLSATRCYRRGGAINEGGKVGLFAAEMTNDAPDAPSTTGSRLMYIPQ